jgi:hypothetical protein
VSREQPLEIGEEVTIGGERALVRTIEALLGEHELRLVLQARPDSATSS